MPWFRCLIEGANFPLSKDGEPALVGFFTTRWVEAETSGEAELHVLALVRNERTFANMRKADVTPTVYVRSISTLSTAPDEAPGAGFTFFDMDCA